jgi:hypothetical protein
MMHTRPTKEQLTAERTKLQRELFWILDEQRRMGITARHRDYWRWKEQHRAALEKLQRFDDQWGSPGQVSPENP